MREAGRIAPAPDRGERDVPADFDEGSGMNQPPPPPFAFAEAYRRYLDGLLTFFVTLPTEEGGQRP